MTNLVKKVQNTIFQYNLLKRGDKILLAVSGGPDSTALLHIFSQLEKKYNLTLAIAHVNYGLRGKDSDRDEKFMRDLAKKYNLPVFVLKPKTGKNPSENELRNIRYDFFEKVRKENNFDLIAVAHNSDDQVETYFMRIIRGSGLQGMSSMKYKNGHIIRPLLALSREEIESYLKEKRLKFRLDKTNRESKYLRNKVRNKLIPYLEKNFNPQIKKTIFSSLESIAEDFSFISLLADKAYAKCKNLDIKDILSLHPAMQKRVILRAISQIRPDLKDIESTHVNEIMKIISSTKNKRQTMRFKGLSVTRIGDKLKIESLNN